jgi:hypothetical protein
MLSYLSEWIGPAMATSIIRIDSVRTVSNSLFLLRIVIPFKTPGDLGRFAVVLPIESQSSPF